MSKPETIKDLYASGVVTIRDIDRMACCLFDSNHAMSDVIDGYVVMLPDFAGLPETSKQFIRKALMFTTVTNILDASETKLEEPEDPGSHYREAAEAKAFHKIVDEHFDLAPADGDDFDHTDTKFG